MFNPVKTNLFVGNVWNLGIEKIHNSNELMLSVQVTSTNVLSKIQYNNGTTEILLYKYDPCCQTAFILSSIGKYSENIEIPVVFRMQLGKSGRVYFSLLLNTTFTLNNGTIINVDSNNNEVVYLLGIVGTNGCVMNSFMIRTQISSISTLTYPFYTYKNRIYFAGTASNFIKSSDQIDIIPLDSPNKTFYGYWDYKENKSQYQLTSGSGGSFPANLVVNNQKVYIVGSYRKQLIIQNKEIDTQDSVSPMYIALFDSDLRIKFLNQTVGFLGTGDPTVLNYGISLDKTGIYLSGLIVGKFKFGENTVNTLITRDSNEPAVFVTKINFRACFEWVQLLQTHHYRILRSRGFPSYNSGRNLFGYFWIRLDSSTIDTFDPKKRKNNSCLKTNMLLEGSGTSDLYAIKLSSKGKIEKISSLDAIYSSNLNNIVSTLDKGVTYLLTLRQARPSVNIFNSISIYKFEH